jgi:hypothetical protein
VGAHVAFPLLLSLSGSRATLPARYPTTQPALLPGYVDLSFYFMFFSRTLRRLRLCFLALEWLAGLWTRVCTPPGGGVRTAQSKDGRQAWGVCFLADRPSASTCPLPSHHHLNQAASHLLFVFLPLPHHDPPTSLISPPPRERVFERRARKVRSFITAAISLACHRPPDLLLLHACIFLLNFSRPASFGRPQVVSSRCARIKLIDLHEQLRPTAPESTRLTGRSTRIASPIRRKSEREIEKIESVRKEGNFVTNISSTRETRLGQPFCRRSLPGPLPVFSTPPRAVCSFRHQSHDRGTIVPQAVDKLASHLNKHLRPSRLAPRLTFALTVSAVLCHIATCRPLRTRTNLPSSFPRTKFLPSTS